MRSTFLRGIRISLAVVAFVLATATISTAVEESIPRVSTAITANADGRRLQSEPNVIEALSSNPNVFSEFVNFAERANLVATLSELEGITVLAPTNDAFNVLPQITPPGFVDNLFLPEYSTHLQDFLLYHVIAQEIPSSAISTGDIVPSIAGGPITFTVDDEAIWVNYYEEIIRGGPDSPDEGSKVQMFGALVVLPDIEASNGIIHGIDYTLAPYWVGSNVIDVINAFDYHSALIGLLEDAELIDILMLEGPFTIFAPTNNALEQYDGSVDLETLLLYHVVPGIYSGESLEEKFSNLESLTTLQGEDIQFGFDLSGGLGSESEVTFNGESFLPVAVDVLALNGIVHSIDQVLIPPSSAPEVDGDGGSIFDVAVADSDTFSSFVSFIELTDLDLVLKAVSGITVFAPNNAGFDSLSDESPQLVEKLESEEYLLHLMDLLRYHIILNVVPSRQISDGFTAESFNAEELDFSVESGSIFINSRSEVVIPDLKADNGILHGIDEVLLPFWVGKNIVDRASESTDLATLTSALVKADLVATLSEEGPFTVFAPTDAAFEEFLDGESIDSLDFDALTKVLTRHVVPGIISDLNTEGIVTLTTISGESLSANFEAFTVGNAIIGDGILAENGVMWVIDKVLPDPGDETTPPTVAPVDLVNVPTPAPQSPVETPQSNVVSLILGPTPAVYNSGGNSVPTPAQLNYIARNMRRPSQGNLLSGL